MNDEIPKHQSKKNTRRWCKGKVGVLHKPMWKSHPRYTFRNETDETRWFVFACQVCDKELDRFYPGMQTRYERPKIGSVEPLKKK